MKKVLALLAIAGFVACNSGESTEAKTDSPAVAVDSLKTVEGQPLDSATQAIVDSTVKADSTKK